MRDRIRRMRTGLVDATGQRRAGTSRSSVQQRACSPTPAFRRRRFETLKEDFGIYAVSGRICLAALN